MRGLSLVIVTARTVNLPVPCLSLAVFSKVSCAVPLYALVVWFILELEVETWRSTRDNFQSHRRAHTKHDCTKLPEHVMFSRHFSYLVV
jgi:hypothetical protein